jgi:uncharacterized protein YndB with AHSA1/START domain
VKKKTTKKKSPARRKTPAPPSDQVIPKIGRVSTESVHKGTGRHWDEWIPLLEKAGARAMTHTELTQYLKKKYKLRPWWQQDVARGFGIHVGLRVEGQNLKGEYMVTKTKSIALAPPRVWEALVSPAGVALWLQPLFPVAIEVGAQFETEDGFFGEIRTLTKARQIRLSWRDPNWEKNTAVQVLLVARPGKNSILCFNHTQIRDLRVLAALRSRWESVIEALAAHFSK